eukprot:4373637-Pyramimonas_sp.AAC.2
MWSCLPPEEGRTKYSYDGPIRRRKRGYILTTDQSEYVSRYGARALAITGTGGPTYDNVGKSCPTLYSNNSDRAVPDLRDRGFLEIRNYGEIIKKLLRVGHDLPILSYRRHTVDIQ